MSKERKDLKEKLKKRIDELSDEELDKIAGGTDGINRYTLLVQCSNCGRTYNVLAEDGKCPGCGTQR